MGGCGAPGSAADGRGEGGSLWWLGVLLSVVSSILSNLGVNTQKLSLMREAAKPAAQVRPYAKQPLWQLGLFTKKNSGRGCWRSTEPPKLADDSIDPAIDP